MNPGLWEVVPGPVPRQTLAGSHSGYTLLYSFTCWTLEPEACHLQLMPNTRGQLTSKGRGWLPPPEQPDCPVQAEPGLRVVGVGPGGRAGWVDPAETAATLLNKTSAQHLLRPTPRARTLVARDKFNLLRSPPPGESMVQRRAEANIPSGCHWRRVWEEGCGPLGSR